MTSQTGLERAMQLLLIRVGTLTLGAFGCHVRRLGKATIWRDQREIKGARGEGRGRGREIESEVR